MPDNPRVDAYIDRQADFAKPILAWLRARVHAACPEAVETIKWGMPFFTYRDRPLANMAAFKAHAAFGLWARQELATGKEGEAMGQRGRIESVDDLPPAAEIEAQVRAGAELIDSGYKPARAARAPKGEPEVPPELVEALAGDAAATAAFTGFPPSCRREYCEWVAEAKRPETKARRVTEAMAMLREGKRRNWKYESC
ncbi:MAG: YdeI/OmpD-associated family protein [Sphingomonas sp.]